MYQTFGNNSSVTGDRSVGAVTRSSKNDHEEEAPSPENREFSWPKLIVALLVEGAIFRLVKGLTDHGARRAFASATGTWPGDEAPDPK